MQIVMLEKLQGAKSVVLKTLPQTNFLLQSSLYTPNINAINDITYSLVSLIKKYHLLGYPPYKSACKLFKKW